MKKIDWTNVAIALAVAILVAAAMFFQIRRLAREECPGLKKDQVCITFLASTPETSGDILVGKSGATGFKGKNTTLAKLLNDKNIQYSRKDIKSIANMPEGTVAVQEDGKLSFREGDWTIKLESGKKLSLSEIDSHTLKSGEKVKAVYRRKEIRRTRLPEKPGFIKYISRSAERNSKGSLTSCLDRGELHEFGGGFRFGTAEMPDYPLNPPVCGAHVHIFPPGDKHKLPANRSAYILEDSIKPLPAELHILGHGMTILHYNPEITDKETVRKLENWTLNHRFVYMTPYQNTNASITITRWGMTANMEEFNRRKLERFQQAPYGISPPMQGEPTFFHTVPHYQNKLAKEED